MWRGVWDATAMCGCVCLWLCVFVVVCVGVCVCVYVCICVLIGGTQSVMGRDMAREQKGTQGLRAD